jgi:tRNA-specific 2-thiouridylase
MAKVVVGLSGGVDSSVAAYLLQEQGHEVIGMFMRNWHDDSVTINNECPWVEDSTDALLVAEHLGIPFQAIDLSSEYKERIVDYMFAEYKAGRTPNPDVLCNREIKFDIFLKAAVRLGADFVATGHYVRKSESVAADGSRHYHLLSGKDPNKDQSYFLCQLTQQQLSKALFPIGELLKPQVRDLARKAGIPVADKKDSQGLCFIGKVRLPEFLQQQLKPKKGNIVEIPATHPMYAATPRDTLAQLATPFSYTKTDGKVLGQHYGAHYFTIGQRKGLHVGGKAEPLFVIATDVVENIVYVGMGENHPGLLRPALLIAPDEVHWVNPARQLSIGESAEYRVRIRYRQELQAATLHRQPEGLYIAFEAEQRGITPGQFAAWHDGDELVGSGVIG